jgi:hypothetical protein
MAFQFIVPMRYLHEGYFGRPSCPRCGQFVMAPEHQEFSKCLSGDEIRNFWMCDACDHRFETLIKFEPRTDCAYARIKNNWVPQQASGRRGS